MIEWLTVIGLSMTPALLGGPSAGVAAGIAFDLSPVPLYLVVAVANFLAGLCVLALASLAVRWAWLDQRLERLRNPKAVAWLDKWGPWGGLMLGSATIGPFPVLIALRWMTIRPRRMLLPLAVSTFVYTAIYYAIVHFGIDQMLRLEELLNL